MSPRATPTPRTLAALLALGAASCLERPVARPTPNLQSGITLSLAAQGIDEVDVLFEIDNSGSMLGNQANLANNLPRLIAGLFPTTPGAVSPIRSLRVGVITSDLGSLGARTTSCERSPRVGDDARLNPFMSGEATRAAASTQAGIPSPPDVTCADRAGLPAFLSFSSTSRSHGEFVCEAFVGASGCGYEQQLEAVYRALVVHRADAPARSAAAPNGGFLRPNAILAIIIVTDEEDGSVVDCENTHPDEPCTAEERRRFERIRHPTEGVFQGASSLWAGIGSSRALNNRFYLYADGSAQDPTWSVDRYIDLARPNHGLLRLKPGHPERIIFPAIAGVPTERDIPRPADYVPGVGLPRVQWDRLLGAVPTDRGFTGLQSSVGSTREDGRVSMRRGDVDCRCGGGAAEGCTAPLVPVVGYERVLPACWRPGSARTVQNGVEQPMPCTFTGGAAYFALPSRRIAEVARRFDALSDGNGMVYSVCETNYRGPIDDIVYRIQRRAGRCLPRPVETTPTDCPAGSGLQGCVRTNCTVREFLPAGTDVAAACSRQRGRTPGGYDPQRGLQTCVVNQVTLRLGEAPPAGHEGFYYDTRPDPASPACRQHVEFTDNARLWREATAELQCVQANLGAASDADAGDAGDAASQ